MYSSLLCDNICRLSAKKRFMAFSVLYINQNAIKFYWRDSWYLFDVEFFKSIPVCWKLIMRSSFGEKIQISRLLLIMHVVVVSICITLPYLRYLTIRYLTISYHIVPYNTISCTPYDNIP